MSKARGARYERELVSHFREAGWGALRLPSSGSATKADLPDVLAGKPELIETDSEMLDSGIVQSTYEQSTELWAIELKSGKSTPLYVEKEEALALRDFAVTWGARPLLAARPTTQATGREHYLVEPASARRTDGGAYGLPRAELAERAFAVVGPEEVVVGGVRGE